MQWWRKVSRQSAGPRLRSGSDGGHRKHSRGWLWFPSKCRCQQWLGYRSYRLRESTRSRESCNWSSPARDARRFHFRSHCKDSVWSTSTYPKARSRHKTGWCRAFDHVWAKSPPFDSESSSAFGSRRDCGKCQSWRRAAPISWSGRKTCFERPPYLRGQEQDCYPLPLWPSLELQHCSPRDVKIDSWKRKSQFRTVQNLIMEQDLKSFLTWKNPCLTVHSLCRWWTKSIVWRHRWGSRRGRAIWL